MIKALKIFVGFLSLLFIVLAIALLWPMPEIKVPAKPQKILIKSVNIVDVKTGKILYDRNVWIQGNRIDAIDSLKPINVDSDVLVIEADDQFLIPGLWDMHTHSTPYSPWLHHPLYISNGVTAIRDMSGQLGTEDSYWAGTKNRLEWNTGLNNNEQITPRYVLHSSYQINGENSVPSGFPEYFKAQTPNDAIALLDYYQSEGADFIKVYSEIPAASYRTLAKECSKYNIHLAGHKPLNISLEEAILSGQRSFEHARIFMFDCFPHADSLLNTQNKLKTFRELMPSMINEFDSAKAYRLMELMRQKESHWTPTLQTVKMSAYADEKEFIESPFLKYIPSIRKTLFWKPDIGRSAEVNRSSDSMGINKQFYESARRQVGLASNRGVPIMAGTDVTDTYVFPGFSLHTELEDLTKSGLSNIDALRAATLVPAQYGALENDLGSVDQGKLADLVLLRSNPLENITNTTTITGVILNGNYYNQATLQDLQRVTEETASSFHLNVKFVYSILASPLMRKQFAD